MLKKWILSLAESVHFTVNGFIEWSFIQDGMKSISSNHQNIEHTMCLLLQRQQCFILSVSATNGMIDRQEAAMGVGVVDLCLANQKVCS